MIQFGQINFTSWQICVFIFPVRLLVLPLKGSDSANVIYLRSEGVINVI